MQRKTNIKHIFFNYPTKHWHFEKIVKTAKLSRSQTNEWLKRLVKEKLVNKVKGKKTYYISNHKNNKFKIQKKLYALSLFEKTDFLAHLSSLKKAKTVIIFGSFARWDWHDQSDIDIFIYGEANDFKKSYFEKKLKREIQVFQYKNKKSLKRLDPNTIPEILSGIHIKGGIKPFEVKTNA